MRGEASRPHFPQIQVAVPAVLAPDAARWFQAGKIMECRVAKPDASTGPENRLTDVFMDVHRLIVIDRLVVRFFSEKSHDMAIDEARGPGKFFFGRVSAIQRPP